MSEDCPLCHGYSQVFSHADDCNSEWCALNGDMDSCQGRIEPCSMCDPDNPYFSQTDDSRRKR